MAALIAFDAIFCVYLSPFSLCSRQKVIRPLIRIYEILRLYISRTEFSDAISYAILLRQYKVTSPFEVRTRGFSIIRRGATSITEVIYLGLEQSDVTTRATNKMAPLIFGRNKVILSFQCRANLRHHRKQEPNDVIRQNGEN